MIKIFLITIFVFSSLFSADKPYRILAQEYEKKGDIKNALDNYFKAANKRDDKALLYLGKLYYQGKHLKQSTKKAIEFLNKASILENKKAKYNLAIIYASKRSKEYHNFKKAFKLFLELAQIGYAPAQNKVGMFLTHGYGGMKKDYVEAVKWYEASSKQCYEDAECNLAFMYVNGKGVWKNFGRAHVFAKKGYENGNHICKAVWNKHKLYKYPNDTSFKFNFYVKPCE